MRLHRQAPRLEARVEAARPISAELLAASTGAPIELAERVSTAWFEALHHRTEKGLVVVFDEFVVGPPEPLLLEVAHHLRRVRRAFELGLFDDEEEHFDDEHAAADVSFEEPTIPDRVLAAIAGGQESWRVVSCDELTADVRIARGRRSETLWAELCLLVNLEDLMAALADSIRIGPAVVIDARRPSECTGCWQPRAA